LNNSDFRITKLPKFADHRGDLVAFLRHSEIEQSHKTFGQIYFVTFRGKDIIRGNHYHKKWKEWFGIIEGKVEVKLENIKTKRNTTLTLSSSTTEYIRLDINNYIAHAFRSKTKYASLLNYADGQWDNTDTFMYPLF